jgi:hypothetical protein
LVRLRLVFLTLLVLKTTLGGAGGEKIEDLENNKIIFCFENDKSKKLIPESMNSRIIH